MDFQKTVLNRNQISRLQQKELLNSFDYKILFLRRNPVEIDNLPYNSDMHGQTSQPLGSFSEGRKQTQASERNMSSGEKMFLLALRSEGAVRFSQLTSTCASPPVTWPVRGCIMLQAASIRTVQLTLWQLGEIAAICNYSLALRQSLGKPLVITTALTKQLKLTKTPKNHQHTPSH